MKHKFLALAFVIWELKNNKFIDLILGGQNTCKKTAIMITEMFSQLTESLSHCGTMYVFHRITVWNLLINKWCHSC